MYLFKEESMKSKYFTWFSVLMALTLVLAGCAQPTAEPTEVPPAPTTAPPTTAPPVGPEIDCTGVSAGDTLTVMYQWSGAEEEKINAIFKPFVDACGVEIVASSTRDAAVLDTAAKSEPPDLLFWPSTSPSLLYTDQLQDFASLGAHAENYADFWIEQGTMGGRWLVLPVKADIKTIIWYSPVQFETFGYSVPTTFAELDALVEQMVADGNVPWSMGMESGPATGWTGSDFIQDLLLVQQGPEYVMGLIDGSVSYDDAGVVEAYETYFKWASDETYTVGGATGTVSTGFLDAIYKVYSDPPEAMMVKQSGFAGGEVAKFYPDLEYGIDYDFFAFPGAQGMQGGADFLMAFGDSAATQAMVAFLTSEEGATAWAEAGFDLSPNKMAAGKYTDAALAKKGAALANAAGFTPDLGDTIPAPFGEAEWRAIVNVVQGEDIEAALAAAAASQREGLALAPKIDCMGASAGDTLTVMYQWSGAEEEKINAIFKPFVDACGVEIVANSTRDAAVLDTAAKSVPPDLLFWPSSSPSLLYTEQLQDFVSIGAHAENYADFWVEQGTVGGRWLVLPVKADIKTIIWYSPVQFETFGYSVPTTFAELDALVEQMVADGNVPWSMGMESGPATGWTGSDFIQDLLLVQQGPEYVMGLIDGSISYDDAGVVEAYETYVKWASDETYTVGGATGTVSTGFLDAIYKVYSDPPEAMMVKQSGFAGGEVAAQYPDLEYGIDYDFFAFPGAQGMQGGADFLMAFGDSAATQAMVAYLTSAEGATAWAKAGFDLSPNKWAAGKYIDAALAKKGAALANAAGFTPDLGDTIPAPFGEAEWRAIVEAVQGGDIAALLATVAAAQAEGLGQ
jgi:alpha-glucoside transport system substrate-binding protein